jgi:hypothetical protein
MNLRSDGFARNFCFSLALVVLEPLRCGSPAPELPAAQFPPAIVIVEGKTTQGFPYLSGGVSSDEREVMEERGKSYNLKLMFAAKTGAYLSNVKLVIGDTKGEEIVSIATNGPWFFIQVPSGSYSVNATFTGETKQIKGLKVLKDQTVTRTLIWDLGEQSE